MASSVAPAPFEIENLRPTSQFMLGDIQVESFIYLLILYQVLILCLLCVRQKPRYQVGVDNYEGD